VVAGDRLRLGRLRARRLVWGDRRLVGVVRVGDGVVRVNGGAGRVGGGVVRVGVEVGPEASTPDIVAGTPNIVAGTPDIVAAGTVHVGLAVGGGVDDDPAGGSVFGGVSFRSGKLTDVEVDRVDRVDADLVVGEFERVGPGFEPACVPDVRGRHRRSAGVHHVVVPREHVLGELDVSREPTLRELAVGGRQRRVVRVVLRPRLAAPLLHSKQHRQRLVGRLVHRSGGVGERVEVGVDGADDPTVEQEEPPGSVRGRPRKATVREPTQPVEPAGELAGVPPGDVVSSLCVHSTGVSPAPAQILSGA